MSAADGLDRLVDRMARARHWIKQWGGAAVLGALAGASGCHHYGGGPEYDPPFPLGQVSDSFWETQQTNAEAADFIFYDHDFSGDSATLTPGATRKLEAVALRLEHAPFPVVVEESPHRGRPELDQKRRQVVVEQLARLNVDPEFLEGRVTVAPAFPWGITAIEAERGYYQSLSGNFAGGAGTGRRFGGNGALFR